MDQEAARDDIRSLRTKLFYGLGSVSFGVKDNGFQTILLLFYNQVVHLPGALVGAALAIALMIDAFVDPVVGYLSDNLRTRWGRRHPLMYGAALPVAVSYLLLWNPPNWSQSGLFVYLVVVAIFVRTLITFYEIPSSALAPELTQDYDQRTSFFGYRLFFAWYGGMIMYVLAFRVFLTPDAVIVRTQLDYTLIPHGAFHDLQGSTLYYRTADATKSLNLAQALVNATPASLQQAVREWAKGPPPSS